MSCTIQMDKGSFYTGGYSVYYNNKSYENGTSAKKWYQKLKSSYIKKATKYKNFKKYKLGNTKGVKK